MVLKLKKKVSTGGRGKAPINKAHLLKAQKAKKLRQAVKAQESILEDTQDTQPQDLEEEQENEEQDQSIEEDQVEPELEEPQGKKQKSQPNPQPKSQPKSQPNPQSKSQAKSQAKSQTESQTNSLQNKQSTKRKHKEDKTQEDHTAKQQAKPHNTQKEKIQQEPQQKKQRNIPNANEEEQPHPLPAREIRKAGEYYILPFKFKKGTSRQLLVKHDTENNILRIINLSIGLDQAALEKIFNFFNPTKVTITREDNILDATVEYSKSTTMEEFFNSVTLPIVLERNIVPLEQLIHKKPEFKRVKKMQEEIDSFMHDYDTTVLEKQVNSADVGREDSHGFRVAVGRKNPVLAEHGSKKEKEIEVLQQKEKEKQLTNFYKFQKTEQFKAEQAEVKKKISTQKKKIAQMVQQRKFKPF